MVKNVAFKEDIIQPFKNNKVLLDGICKSEHEKLDSNKIYINLVKQEPICVGIPGGFLGIQAFYGILENILRNTAKHNVEYIKKKINLDNNWKLTLNIDFSESSPNLWHISIYDNIEREKKEINKLINEVLIPYLKNGIIDEKGKLLPGAWGLKEMVICAAYLRGLPLTTIQNPLNNHILEPYIKEENKNQSKGYLGFKFYMLKPMVVLIVTQQEIKNLNPETLRSMGIYVKNSLPDDVPHPILIIENSLREEYEKRIKECPGAYPVKIFYKNNDDIKNFLKASNIDEQIAIYEKKFVKQLMCRPYFVICTGNRDEVKFLKKAFSINGIKPSCYNNYNFVWDNKVGKTNHIKGILEELLKKSRYLVILEHHQNRRGIIDELWRKGHSQRIFYESYKGGSPLEHILLSSPEDRYKCEILFRNLILAGLLKIMILDERISEAVRGEKITLEYMKIFVPPEEIDLKSPKENEIEKYIDQKKPHIIAIHAGILDKMGKKTSEEVKQWVKKVSQNNRDSILKIIIISGRGRPTNVPDTIPFLSITPIEHYTIYNRSKFHLVEEILAARRIKHE